MLSPPQSYDEIPTTEKEPEAENELIPCSVEDRYSSVESLRETDATPSCHLAPLLLASTVGAILDKQKKSLVNLQNDSTHNAGPNKKF